MIVYVLLYVTEHKKIGLKCIKSDYILNLLATLTEITNTTFAASATTIWGAKTNLHNLYNLHRG